MRLFYIFWNINLKRLELCHPTKHILITKTPLLLKEIKKKNIKFYNIQELNENIIPRDYYFKK